MIFLKIWLWYLKTMNVNYLKYALEVNKTGSITQAAEHLFMSQPNLSRDIKELEESLSITIFSRTSRGVVPTVEGKEFLANAKKLIEHIEELENKFSKTSSQKTMYSISIPRASYIASAVSFFINDIEDVLGEEFLITVKETNAIQAVSNITENNYDFGVIRYPVMYESYFHTLLYGKGLDYEDLVTLKYLVVVSENSPLAKKTNVSLNELQHYIEIVHGDLTVPYLSLANNIQDLTPSQNSPRKLAIFERGSQFCLLKNVRSSYMWASSLPEEVLKSNKIIQISCPEANDEYRDAIVYPANRVRKKFEEKFLEKLKEHIQDNF